MADTWVLTGKTHRKFPGEAPVKTDKGMMPAEKVSVGTACEVWVNGGWVPGKMLGVLPTLKYTLILTAVPGTAAEAIQAGLTRAFSREMGTDNTVLIDAAAEVVPEPKPVTMPPR